MSWKLRSTMAALGAGGLLLLPAAAGAAPAATTCAGALGPGT